MGNVVGYFEEVKITNLLKSKLKLNCIITMCCDQVTVNVFLDADTQPEQLLQLIPRMYKRSMKSWHFLFQADRALDETVDLELAADQGV